MDDITLDRKIYIIGDIDHESYLKFTRKLSRLEDLHEEGTAINIVLCSDGGVAMVALAFYERIKMSHLEVVITATGLVASAAVLVLAAGDHRRMSKSAWAMVHEDTVSGVSDDDSVAAAERKVKHYRRVEDQWNQLMADCSTTPVEKWAELHKAETFLTADECLTLGLIDKILE